jgi:GT2 family glycosyltransferase
MLVSIIISTHNRASALDPTLQALSRQSQAASDYEVLVVDDGSTDDTPEVLRSISVPFTLRTYRVPKNRGVSAGRNVGLRNASGTYLIILSDDVLVPPDFVEAHIATLQAYPNAWVVGGFRQLPSLVETPFGRYLNGLEEKFERARLGAPIASNLYEMTTPTVRNLSLRRSDLQLTGLFDERFRVTCEDQDLAHRAGELGIRFIYNAALDCVHNDQAADIRRYCRFQERGASDTVRLCEKYPNLHGDAPVARVNGYIAHSDGVLLATRKTVKRVLAGERSMRALEAAVGAGERIGLPDPWLYRSYRLLIGLHMFRGYRKGLRERASGHGP